jgi:hypothetical protein
MHFAFKNQNLPVKWSIYRFGRPGAIVQITFRDNAIHTVRSYT